MNKDEIQKSVAELARHDPTVKYYNIGKNCTLHWTDVEAIKTLLPLTSKLELFGISDVEIEAYYESTRRGCEAEAIRLLKSKWFHRDTGEPAMLDEAIIEYIVGEYMSLRTLLLRLRDHKYSLSKVRAIIEFFTCEGSELYNPKEYE